MDDCNGTPVHRRFDAWAASTGESLTQLGAKLGCDSSYVSMLRHGRKWPGRRIANAIERETAAWTGGQIMATEWDAAEDASKSSGTAPSPEAA